MIIFSVIAAFFGGTADILTSAIISSASDAVSLCIRLGGTICLWGGLMEIAEQSGLTGAVCKLLSPFLKLIFPKMDIKGQTAKAISMNVTANLLGLGNAATPLGLEAMRRLKAENPLKEKASTDMIKFVVMNSAALHLIPTTVAAMRQDYGSKNPFDIMPASWISSACALTVGLVSATVLIRLSEGIKWKK
jgi:spore maturation protein A